MTTKTAKPFRVACPEYAVEASTYAAAFQRMLQVEALGACHADHRVEARHEGEWIPAHLAMARTALAAKVGATIETFGGPLTKNTGTWTAEAAVRANQAAGEGTPEWYAALGEHAEATLTADGRGANVHGWCDCARPADGAQWVRYERWSARGQEAHGFVCPGCRRLTQTG